MSPRRILIFSFAYHPRFVGGAEVAVKEITDRISPAEAIFDMVTIGDGRGAPTEKIGNITIHRVFKDMGTVQKLLFPFMAARKAAELHREHPYDAVWSIMASYAGYAGHIFKEKHPQIPFILTIQEGDHFGRREGFLKPLFRKIFKAADQITAISTFLADWARDMGAACPITIVPNAVDIESFSRPLPSEAAEDLRAKLGKKDGDVYMVTTSRLVEKNAIGDVIESLRYLPANVKFLILGEGPDEEALKKQVTSLKLDGRVTFLGYVPHADMPPYLHVSDIFVRPSLSEGLGNSFLEAMAAGIPVIATPVGGIPDFLRDGETGLFCEPKNPRSIAQKVEKLMRDRESRDYIVRNARKMVEERYGWAEVAGEMKTILDSARLKG